MKESHTIQEFHNILHLYNCYTITIEYLVLSICYRYQTLKNVCFLYI